MAIFCTDMVDFHRPSQIYLQLFLSCIVLYVIFGQTKHLASSHQAPHHTKYKYFITLLATNSGKTGQLIEEGVIAVRISKCRLQV